MKQRLIDANRLKRVLDINFGGFGGAAVLAQLIDAQPTAYDLDGVVEQLGKASTEEGAEWVRLQRRGTVGLIPKTDMHSYASSCYDRAIELVKGGGIDE